MRSHFLLLLLALSFFTTNGQQSIPIDGRQSTVTTYFIQHQDDLGLTNQDEMSIKSTIKSPNKWIRYRFEQLHQGFLVVGSQATLHEHDGVLKKYSGTLAPNVTVQIGFSIDNAAIQEICNQAFNNTFEVSVVDTVIIGNNYPGVSNSYSLAYEVVAFGEQNNLPFKQKLFIDTQSGKIIEQYSLVKFGSEVAIVDTKYYGSKAIITESVGEEGNQRYILRDYTRGSGVITVNGQSRPENADYTYADFESEDNTWEWDGSWETESALDAHYCAEKYYDYMFDRFEYSGLDGDGSELVCVTNVSGKYYVNAYWNGNYTHYGNGDCANYDPLTTLDVVGHEFTHGFTDYTSDLIYRNESGALNESISDIFGKALEYQYDFNNFDWFIGSRFRENEDVNVFRSMSDPNDRNDPKYYGGLHWYTSSGDNGGVHSNSGVLNYWFYLLCEGGSIINEIGNSYTIEAIGMDKAMDVVFSLQAGYLGQNSTYVEAMYYSLDVAQDLFGEGSVEYSTILDTWAAVGLFPGFDSVDLKIVIHEGHERFYCSDNTPRLTATIYNVGTQNYPDNAVTITSDFLPIQELIMEPIALPTLFAPGDSLNIDLTNIAIEQDQYHGFNLTIQNDDYNQLNNVTNENLFQFIDSSIDLELDIFTLNYASSCNRDTILGYTYRIENNGCSPIPADSIFYLDLYQSNGDVHTIELQNFSTLNPRSTRYSTRYFSEEDEEILDFVSVTLRYADDMNLDNNTLENEESDIIVVERGYYEGFGSAEQLDFNITGSTFVSQENVIDYLGNAVFAVKGRANASSFINCPDEEDFYQYNYHKKTLNFCVDAANMFSPVFSFKTLSLENTSENIPEANFRTMLFVVIDGEEQLFTDLSVGSYTSHTFNLPKEYVGSIEVTAFVLSGNSTPFEEVGTDADFLLFDDFALSELSSIQSTSTQQGFVAYPNPTKDLLKIEDQNGSSYFNIQVFNAQGQLIMEDSKISKEYMLNTSEFNNGFYNARIIRNDQIVSTLKFVKTN